MGTVERDESADDARRIWEEANASQEALKAIRNEYLREERNEEWRKLAKKGTLDDHLEFKANECRRLAERLIAQGQFYRQAWYQAKAAELLNQPTID